MNEDEECIEEQFQKEQDKVEDKLDKDVTRNPTDFKIGKLAGYKLAKQEMIEKIDERLKDYHIRLSNKSLPDLVKANLSGMILALEELKKDIK